MEINEIIPEHPEFSLAKTNKTYKLRPPTLKDTVWIKEKIGEAQDLQKVFEHQDWNKIIKLVYHLMEDKSDFMAQKKKEISDEGVEIEIVLTGPDVLLESIGLGEEQFKVLGALTTAITKSSPIVDKYVKEELKKKQIEQTSESSLNSSQVNTDGQ